MEQLLVGERANLTGFAFPDERRFVLAPCLHVPIQAVVGEVDLPSHEPFCLWRVPLQNPVPFLKPVQFARNAAPEFLWLLDRLPVQMLVLVQALNVSTLTKVIAAFKLALLLQHRVDTGVGIRKDRFFSHGWTPGFENRALRRSLYREERALSVREDQRYRDRPRSNINQPGACFSVARTPFADICGPHRAHLGYCRWSAELGGIRW